MLSQPAVLNHSEPLIVRYILHKWQGEEEVKSGQKKRRKWDGKKKRREEGERYNDLGKNHNAISKKAKPFHFFFLLMTRENGMREGW